MIEMKNMQEGYRSFGNLVKRETAAHLGNCGRKRVFLNQSTYGWAMTTMMFGLAGSALGKFEDSRRQNPSSPNPIEPFRRGRISGAPNLKFKVVSSAPP
jgi:hypothetical protein